MRAVLPLLLALVPAMATVAQAQTLDVHPAPLSAPRPGNQARHGEVVLGQTTLSGTRRMFADLLATDSVTVARGHQGNPAPTPAGTVWEVATHRIQPSYRLDLGPDRYALYYDKHERLIAAVGRLATGALTMVQVVSRYPSLVKGRLWYGGDRPRNQQWTVALDACVTLEVSELVGTGSVERVSYLYTCPTRA